MALRLVPDTRLFGDTAAAHGASGASTLLRAELRAQPRCLRSNAVAGRSEALLSDRSGGSLARSEALLERVLCAWAKDNRRGLMRRLLSSWSEAVRSSNDGPLMLQRMMEEEYEKLSRKCAEETRRAGALSAELEVERSRLPPSEAWSPAPGGDGPSPSAGGSFVAVERTTVSEALVELDQRVGDLRTHLIDRSEKLGRAAVRLFRHAVEQRCGSAEEAHRRWRDASGQISRRSFASLVVEVLERPTHQGVATSKAATTDLAEMVGAIWPLLDMEGSGLVSEEAFVRLLAGPPAGQDHWGQLVRVGARIDDVTELYDITATELYDIRKAASPPVAPRGG